MQPITGTYTDFYQLTMAEAYFLAGRGKDRAVFDYFFRKSPFNGGYTVFAGLDVALEALETLRFDETDMDFLRGQRLHPDFLRYLEGYRFAGDIYSSREGDLIFPTRPVLTVEAGIIEAQMIETLLLNLLNFQSLIATKASRIRQAAGDAVLVDFGLRRAQGLGGYYASRAAVVGGFDATSNVRASRDFGVPVSGTMAHSFIQSFDDELAAFRAFAERRPEGCVLLVDTYDTLRSGMPNAVKVGLEMRQRGQQLMAVRLDSGDLAYLAGRAREMLDGAGLHDVKIAASNQLDEYVIRSLRAQGAPIDIYGVGTRLVTGRPDAALDGVYKLAFSGGKPRIKLSETREKITLPFNKQVFRILDAGERFRGADVVALRKERGGISAMHHPSDPYKSMRLDDFTLEPLMKQVMHDGRRLNYPRELPLIREYARERLARLPDEYKRFENPHEYKVGLSDRLHEARNRVINEYRREMR